MLANSEDQFMLENSEDPDQAPQNAAPDLGMHCLPMSQNGKLGL